MNIYIYIIIFDIAQKIEADKGFDRLSDIQDNFHETKCKSKWID